MSEQAIDSKAESVFLETGVDPQSLPVDPAVLAKKLGIKVFSAPLKMDLSGVLIRSSGDVPLIYVNENDAPARQRFSVAHEIGHYVLHSDLKGDFSDTRDEISLNFRRTEESDDQDEARRRREIQANKFAASLLMPGEVLRRVIKKNDDLSDLAEIFGVSIAAIGYRVNDLGIGADG